jgi:hypothetical protein
MNDRKQNHVGTVGRLLLLSVLACFGLAAAQGPVKKKEPEKITTAAPACSSDDKIEVTAFSLNPTEARAGQSVTATMTIKNKCPNGTADLNVPWKLYLDDQVIKTGTSKISAGSSADVTASWTAVGGSHHFYGEADPRNEKIRENNTRPDVVIDVPQSSVSPATTQLETQVLNYQKAKLAGAQFWHGVAGYTLCTPIGQFDPAEFGESVAGNSVVFDITCSYGVLTGARANPEAFQNFTLKNGWKIKSIEITPEYRRGLGHGEWQWTTRPSRGSDNPYVQMHLVAEDRHSVQIYIKITIEGPAGTDPYQ